MSEFGIIPQYQGSLHPWSVNAIGTVNTALGGNGIASFTSAVVPSGSLAIFVPFYMETHMIIQNMYWLNGTVAAGNIEMAIYSADGRKLFGTGAQLQSGTSVIQNNIFSPPQHIWAGLYYMAIVASSASATLFGIQNIFTTGTMARLLGMAQAPTSYPLPESPTLISVGQEYVPAMGFSSEVGI